MKVRTITEIEEAFREMGLTETTWGQKRRSSPEAIPAAAGNEQIFVRLETTTTPLEQQP